ncbi:unnamed protein product [Polarella glacialis]|uniref:EF-hand domain-containing protein n=1 Tax=Polarella glacialis TaxID=89957 RepID=A0A813DEC6_POLGL|nr:unnamed protein product [Polarella glacialis]
MCSFAYCNSTRRRVSFAELCAALHQCHFKGNFKAIWKELDKDGSGFITFDEFDSRAAEVLGAFEALVLDKYSSFLEAWKAFDVDGNGCLTESEFVSRCTVLGYAGNSRKLFKYLLSKAHNKHVTLSDFAPGAYQESLLDPDRNKDLSRKDSVSRAKAEENARRMERFDLRALKNLLVKKHGSLAAAWKQGLDLDRNGKLTFAEFSKAVRELGFHGNIKACWAELNADGSNDVSLAELDPKAHAHLFHFEQHVQANHGSYSEAWAAANIAPGTRIHEAKFQQLCREFDYDGDTKEVFKHLIAKPGVSSFSLTELDGRVLQESHYHPDRLNPTSAKEKLEAWNREKAAHDMAATDLAAMKRLLVNRYGSIPAAWRHSLDPDGNNQVSFAEFGNAMREIGYKGGIKDAWKELDKDGNGFITPDEFDPVSHRVLSRFRDWLEAWDFLDAKKNHRVDEPTFAQRCEELGYEGDTSKLFKYLLAHASFEFILLKDLDPNAAKELHVDPDRFSTQLKKEEYDRAQAEIKEQQKSQIASDVPSLMKLLRKRFGTITQAWRHGLDLHGNGRISFMEFCRALQQLCVRGNLKLIFKDLDFDGNGSLTLAEFDPQAHEAVAKFKELIQERYGSFPEAWSKLDTKKKGQMNETDLLEQCELLGYEGDASQLFRYLLYKARGTFITMEDLDPHAAHEHRLEVSDPKDVGAYDFKSLRSLLVNRYGTMPAAWKHCLDLRNNGFVGFVEFSKAMRMVGFKGSPRELWAELEKDEKGHVTLEAFDAQAFQDIKQFKELTLQRHGDMLTAWEVFDQNRNGSLDEAEFADICADLGYEGDSGRLFQMLLDEPCSVHLTLADVDFEAWQEPASDPERFSSGADLKAALERKAEEFMARGNVVADLPGLKRVLANKYGTMSCAWKHCMDSNKDGRISFMEWGKALRGEGFRGPIRELWLELDKDSNGTITLGEFDPESDKVLTEFRDLVLKSYATFPEAWASMFGVGEGDQVVEDAFTEGLFELGYEEDAHRLFRYLLEKPLENSHFIKLENFEPFHLKRSGRDLENALKEELVREGLI